MGKSAGPFVRANLSRRRFLSSTALAGIGLAGGSGVLTACGGGSSGGPGGQGGGGGSQGAGSVTWASWANPGEGERFRAYSKDYQAKSGMKVTWQNVVGSYPSKMLTQLAGGSAPDAFYVGDDLVAKAIDAKVLADLKDEPAAKAVWDQTYPGLRKWTQSKDGGIYGIGVDCNPATFWFNKKMLADAGVTQDPAALFEAGKWTIDACTDLLTKIKATGKKGMVLEATYGWLFSWITAFGGKLFDDNDKAIFDTDAKSMEAITWLFEQINNGNITFGGSLPKGQGVDALFYSGQLATIQYGRWILPNLRKLKGRVEYDIAPYPSPGGKEIPEVVVFTACMSVNAKPKDKAAAVKFTADFCGKEGQQYRLAGGGNAVPSISGLEGIVTEGNDPVHAKYFNEIASKGYAVPTVIAQDPKKASDFPLKNDVLLKDIKNQTPKSYASALAKLLNA